MKYLLLTHVPTYAGQSAGVVRMSERFHDDLAAQAAALHAEGFAVTLATPRHAAPDAKALSRDRFVDVRPDAFGVEDVPLAPYTNMPQFMAAGVALKDVILEHADDAAVVQMGAGGHPTALGQFAWPLIDPKKHRRLFVFAGDPVPAREKHITSGRNPAKRLAKRLAVRRFETFCRQAVREADLVFAHAPAVARRFGQAWQDHCHAFSVAPLHDRDLADGAALAARDRRTADASKPLRVVAVGSDVPTAGLDHLLRAVAKAARLGAKLELRLYARKDASSATQRLLDTADGRATWHAGRLDAAAFDTADLFAAAPLVPGENSAVFAAAARGLPIVSYQDGPATDAVAAAKGGVCVARGDTDGFAQALLDLARDRGRLPATSVAARDWAAGQTREAVHRRRATLARDSVMRESVR